MPSESVQHLPSPSTSESSFHSAASELHHPDQPDHPSGIDDVSFLSNNSEGTIRQKKHKKLELLDPTTRKRSNTTSKLKERKTKLLDEDVFLASSSDVSRQGEASRSSSQPRSNDASPARHRESSPSVPPSSFPVRTPARTKRRSVSSQLSPPSSPVTDTHGPSFHVPPQDYATLLSTPAPLLFSTTLERQLLNNLNTLGFDIGQMVHSVLSDACDASGAIWWMLKRKAEKKALEAAFTKPKESVINSADGLQRDADTEADTEIEYGFSANPSPGFPDSPAVENIMRTIDQANSAPELSLIPATPTVPATFDTSRQSKQQDSSNSPPITPPRSKSPRSMLSPTPTSEASVPASNSVKSTPSTPSGKDKENNLGSKGRSSGKPRSGSVSIVQRATTAALEAAGLVRKKSNEGVKEKSIESSKEKDEKDKDKEKDKEKERASSSTNESNSYSKSSHGHARLTKSPPLKPVKDVPLNIHVPSTPDRTANASDLSNASPWVMPTPVARSSTFDVGLTPSNTFASSNGLHETGEGKHQQPNASLQNRNRNSLLHTFRTWFNEERKNKRKAPHPPPTASGSNLATIPASPTTGNNTRTSFRRGRGGYKARSKRVSVSSRRSSSVNSRRSSAASMQKMVLDGPGMHGHILSEREGGAGVSRKKSDPSSSRPSSIHSYNMHAQVRHKKSTSFGSTGSTARMGARAASPLHAKYHTPQNPNHHRAGSSSSTRAVRNVRHSKGSTSTPRPRHVRSNSATSSIQSSRPGSFYDASDAEIGNARTGSPLSYYNRTFEDYSHGNGLTPRRSNSLKLNVQRRHHHGSSSGSYSQSMGGISAAATLTRSVSRTSWKKSWGTEPPGWRSRSTQFPVEVLAISPAPDSHTTIRDVFSGGHKGNNGSGVGSQTINLGDEDEWVDEDEDDFPTFAGGLGQLASGTGAGVTTGPVNSTLKQSFELPTAMQSSPAPRGRGSSGHSHGGRKASGGGGSNARNASKSGHSPTTGHSPLPGTDGVFDAHGHGHNQKDVQSLQDAGRMNRRALPGSGRSGAPAFRGPTKIIEEEEEEEE